MTDLDQMNALLAKQRSAFLKDGAVSAELRIDRLSRAIDLLFDNQQKIIDASAADFGCRSRHQVAMEIYATLESLKHAKKHTRRWMKPERRKVAFPLNVLGAKGRLEYQAKGVVGIIGTWNFPSNTVFAPLAGVFAAGNRATAKFSEVSPATAELWAELIPTKFDEAELGVVTGGPEVGAAFSGLPFDHLVFTGSGAIGRKVMAAAAANLTPVTLELGGKSPVIVARDTNLQEAAVRIMMGKILNSGQACLSPDYAFVPKEKLEEFVSLATEWAAEMYPSAKDNDDYTSVVNARHHGRLNGLLDEAREAGVDVRELNPAGEDFAAQEGTHKLPLTLVIDPPEDLRISQEEIFGPILILRGYDRLDECIDYINAHDRPLGLYLFSDDKAVRRQVLDHTRSGGVTINDCLTHVSVEDLPFGGIGPSGMGHYHGVEGFRAFSHARAVYKQSKLNLQRLGGMVPPYGEDADKNLGRMIRK